MKLKSRTYKEGWNAIYGAKVENVFTQFMNKVFIGDIQEAMREFKRR